jgi:chloride channel protein, CIC family
MFLVRRAGEVMDHDFAVVPASMSFDAFLANPDNRGRMRHVVVADGNRILGVLRVNTALRRISDVSQGGAAMGEIAARSFTLVREDDVVFDVIRRMSRKGAFMALVVRDRRVPRPSTIAGVITKEHVADSVAASVQTYPA